MENTKEKSLLGDTFEEGKKPLKHDGDEESFHAKTQKLSSGSDDQMNVKQENISSNPPSSVENNLAYMKEAPLQTSTDKSSMETNSKDSSSVSKNQEDLLKSAKAKMGEVKEENERLKLLLAQMLKDYQSLQKNFFILQQEEAKKSTDTSFTRRETEEHYELISLSLGRGSSTDQPKKDEKENDKEDQNLNGGLSLGLLMDCRLELNSTEPAEKKTTSSENSLEEVKEEADQPTETWPPSKNLKTMRNIGDDQEVLEQTHLKKVRVSVRARCDTPTMHDGCQWRKYGQKIAKGNPCPRAYYRCTVSPNCPVRKQVQRWVEDMSILITTYEGTHNHPLPVSATAMASTTSAAASMLQCRSSKSQEAASGLNTSVSAPNSTSTSANFHGLNFTSFSGNDARPHQFYLPSSSISTTTSHPTITLDLTSPTNSSHYFNRPSSAPICSSTCLNFSSPSSTNSLDPNNSWNNAGYLSYGTLSYNNRNHFGIPNLGQAPSYMQMNNNLAPPQQSWTDQNIAATTKVITSNPNFQSALAAAISSYIANGGGKTQQNMVGSGDNSGLKLKWPDTETFPAIPAAYSSAQNRSGCASSFLNKLAVSSNNSQQQGNMSIFPFSLPFSTSKGASGSPADTKDHVKL